jgi:hypothetical protein
VSVLWQKVEPLHGRTQDFARMWLRHAAFQYFPHPSQMHGFDVQVRAVPFWQLPCGHATMPTNALQEQQQIKMLAEARERSLHASLAVFPSVLPAATSIENYHGAAEQAQQAERADRSGSG